MRFKQPAILHGLPRNLAVSGDTKKRDYPEHLSVSVLQELVRTGRSVEALYSKHVEECRDCYDFFMEFCAGERRLANPE
jgi:hypothetical protein